MTENILRQNCIQTLIMNVSGFYITCIVGPWLFRMRLIRTFDFVTKLYGHVSFLVCLRWVSLDNAFAAALFWGLTEHENKLSRKLNYTVKAPYIVEIFNVLLRPHRWACLTAYGKTSQLL